MRPVRLEVEGFTAFRERTTVDFDGVDLFAFTGPTGSGKSSLVDAMVFALYGSVPRYDNRNLVAPAISQGAAEARVRLDFTVDGRPYTAVRVVRRTKTGATTKEARLETDGGQVLAGNEKELGREVERLLGLGYDHFCKCVVLPQGRFADFLHDKPEGRQELLVELLDLGIYRRMGQLARQRASEARLRSEALGTGLTALTWATPEARAATATRLGALREALTEIERQLPGLEELGRRVEAARTLAGTARESAASLASVAVPSAVQELAAARRAADDRAKAERETEAAAEEATADVDRALGDLTPRSDLEELLRRHERRAAQAEQADKAHRLLVERRDHETAAAEAFQGATAVLGQAEKMHDTAVRTHRAHAVAADLVAGEPCPVCRQLVRQLPQLEFPADLTAAQTAVDAAKAAVERASGDHRHAERDRHTAEDRLATITDEITALDGVLEGAVDAPSARAQLSATLDAEGRLASARAAEAAARKRRRAAEERLAAVTRHETSARVEFDRARDIVAAAATGPPPDRSDDLGFDWEALAAFATAEATDHRERATDAETTAAELDRERTDRMGALVERVAALDVDSAERPIRDAVVDTIAKADSQLDRLDEALAEVERLRHDLSAQHTAAAIAADLGRHLAATGFEKWMLDEALVTLVGGATEILAELSGGQYSLSVDPRSRNFTVIDHRNADQPRSARTLSGGETFLASLALALALADRLALLAARGGARLESLFLDEGFGSLDPATLDVVASAIEELGAKGRMVGLISHVAELAERVPVRYVVGRSAGGATVERVEA